MRGWEKKEKTEDIANISEAWLKGFFLDSHDNWDGKSWNRNFTELRKRDLALMCLGDVSGKKVLDIGCGEEPMHMFYLSWGQLFLDRIWGQWISKGPIKKNMGTQTI